MDAERFDRIAKVLGSGTTRRQVVQGLIGSSLTGAAIVSRATDAQAGKPCEGNTDCPRNQLCNIDRCESCRQGRVTCIDPFTNQGRCCNAGGSCCVCRLSSGVTRYDCGPAGAGSAASSCNAVAGDIGPGTRCVPA